MYWGPKFRNMNPYPVPWILPQTVSVHTLCWCHQLCGCSCNIFQYFWFHLFLVEIYCKSWAA